MCSLYGPPNSIEYGAFYVVSGSLYTDAGILYKRSTNALYTQQIYIPHNYKSTSFDKNICKYTLLGNIRIMLQIAVNLNTIILYVYS